MSEMELEYHRKFAKRILDATEHLFGDQPITDRIRMACSEYEQQCKNILLTRGVSQLTIAIVGAKGQGKSWIARQMVINTSVRDQIPSGVLAKESTTKLVWIGPTPPDHLQPQSELFLQSHSDDLIPLGLSYSILDTPGVTHSDRQATQATRRTLEMAPIKIFVVRRDQMRASINSELAAAIEGAICLPIVTAIPLKELPHDSSDTKARTEGPISDSLQTDLRQLFSWMQASAPQTKFLTPILVEDFEASGREESVGARIESQIRDRLSGQSLEELAYTKTARLTAAKQKVRRSVAKCIDQEAPYLATSIRKLQEEARALPIQAVEAVLGSSHILHTAIRGRLRAQFVSETSLLWFPYRTLLSILSLTQGAWDRLFLALTGSVPSLFGTLTTWAKNVQQSQKAEVEMRDGIRDRLLRQVEDRLHPIHRHFHQALNRLKHSESVRSEEATPQLRLSGIEQLQTRARQLFETQTDTYHVSSFVLQAYGFGVTLLFWAMLSGPIVWIYSQYFGASWTALSMGSEPIDFPHPPASMILTSVLLSLVPIFLIAMILLSFHLRGSKIRSIAHRIMESLHGLIDELRREDVLCLAIEDTALEQALFLVQIDRDSVETPSIISNS